MLFELPLFSEVEKVSTCCQRVGCQQHQEQQELEQDLQQDGQGGKEEGGGRGGRRGRGGGETGELDKLIVMIMPYTVPYQ